MLIDQTEAINIASDGLFTDEYEIMITPSWSECKVPPVSYQNLNKRVLTADLPKRTLNVNEASMRGIDFIRKGKVKFSGTVSMTFIESMTSEIATFWQGWLDLCQLDGSYAKSMTKEVMLDFTFTQYMPDRRTISLYRKLFYCLPVDLSAEGHSEKATDVTKTGISIHYTTFRSSPNDNIKLQNDYRYTTKY